MKKQPTQSAFTDEQAEAIVEALKAWSKHLATKEDLKDLRKELKKGIKDLRKDMQRMRWQLTVSITLATSAVVSIVNYLFS